MSPVGELVLEYGSNNKLGEPVHLTLEISNPTAIPTSYEARVSSFPAAKPPTPPEQPMPQKCMLDVHMYCTIVFCIVDDQYQLSCCVDDHYHLVVRMYMVDITCDKHVCTKNTGLCLLGLENFPQCTLYLGYKRGLCVMLAHSRFCADSSLLSSRRSRGKYLLTRTSNTADPKSKSQQQAALGKTT